MSDKNLEIEIILNDVNESIVPMIQKMDHDKVDVIEGMMLLTNLHGLILSARKRGINEETIIKSILAAICCMATEWMRGYSDPVEKPREEN